MTGTQEVRTIIFDRSRARRWASGLAVPLLLAPLLVALFAAPAGAQAVVNRVGVIASDPLASESGVGGGAPDPGTFTFVRVTEDVSEDLPITYTVLVTSTATSGTDYTALTGTAVISSSRASVDVPVAVLEDVAPADEGDETVIVEISADPSYDILLPLASATVTIADADVATVGITASDATAGESGALGTGAFLVSRAAPANERLVVSLAVPSGSALMGADYVPVPLVVVLEPLAASATVTITPIDDAIDESTESVEFRILSGSGYSIDPLADDATVTIADDETATVAVVATDREASEAGSDPALFTFVRPTGDVSIDLPITVSYAGADPVNDFETPLPATVTIREGAREASLLVIPEDDADTEGTETLTVTILPGANYNLGVTGVSDTINILDNEVPTITATAFDATASETGLDPGVFRIARDALGATDFNVTYRMDGTATNGADYAPLGGIATIPAGQLFVAINVVPRDDPLAEGVETVQLVVIAGDTYNVGGLSPVINLGDNELPTVTVEAGPLVTAEGAAGPSFVFTRLTNSFAAPLTVTYTVHGTASTADYSGLPGTATIQANFPNVTVPVTIVDDNLNEPPETLTVSIAQSPTTYFTFGPALSATVRILDNEPTVVTVTASDATALESASLPAVFTVSRTGDASEPLVVPIQPGGTARPGADYLPFPPVAVFPPGVSSFDIVVRPIDDVLDEDDATPETVTLAVVASADAVYTVGGAAASATIADNDVPTVIVLPVPPVVPEQAAAGPVQFVFLRLFTDSIGALDVDFVVLGTASNDTDANVADDDYEGLPTTISFDDGSNVELLPVVILDDALVEFPVVDTITVVVTADATLNTLGVLSSATIRIVSNE